MFKFKQSLVLLIIPSCFIPRYFKILLLYCTVSLLRKNFGGLTSPQFPLIHDLLKTFPLLNYHNYFPFRRTPALKNICFKIYTVRIRSVSDRNC